MKGMRSGVFSHTHKILGVTPKKGTAPKLKISKLTDFDKQMVYIEVIDHAECKSDLIFELGLLLHCHFGYSC